MTAWLLLTFLAAATLVLVVGLAWTFADVFAWVLG